MRGNIERNAAISLAFYGTPNHGQNASPSPPTTYGKALAQRPCKTRCRSEFTPICLAVLTLVVQNDRRTGRDLHIQIPHIQRVLLDEFAARFDLVAHQHTEEFVGTAHVFHANLQ
jgi:hypothetical protein